MPDCTSTHTLACTRTRTHTQITYGFHAFTSLSVAHRALPLTSAVCQGELMQDSHFRSPPPWPRRSPSCRKIHAAARHCHPHRHSSGIGMFRTPPRYLAPGDVVSATIEMIGTLSNPQIDAPRRTMAATASTAAATRNCGSPYRSCLEGHVLNGTEVDVYTGVG